MVLSNVAEKAGRFHAYHVQSDLTFVGTYAVAAMGQYAHAASAGASRVLLDNHRLG